MCLRIANNICLSSLFWNYKWFLESIVDVEAPGTAINKK